MKRLLEIAVFIIISLVAVFGLQNADITDLEASPDFRTVVLRWKYRKDAPEAAGFLIHYCEDQVWGKYKCRDKEIKSSEVTEITPANQDGNYRYFKAKIWALRMATNYTIDVKPLFNYLDGESSAISQRARALQGHIFIQTKGFFARAINCLSNTSLVEIATGPYFGGMISVEGSADKKCSIQGNSSSPQTSYLLTIDHNICGSERHNTSVKTFVLVQETLPILTHSTRRFMLICNYIPETFTVRAGCMLVFNYIPETFTVRAGVNLPDYEESPNNLVPVDQDVVEMDPSEFFDSSGSLFNSRVGKQVGRALRFSSEKKEESQKWTHVILMTVLVMATVFGLICAIMHYKKVSKQKARNEASNPQEETSEASYEIGGTGIAHYNQESEYQNSSLGSFSQPTSINTLTMDDMVSGVDHLLDNVNDNGHYFNQSDNFQLTGQPELILPGQIERGSMTLFDDYDGLLNMTDHPALMVPLQCDSNNQVSNLETIRTEIMQPEEISPDIFAIGYSPNVPLIPCPEQFVNLEIHPDLEVFPATPNFETFIIETSENTTTDYDNTSIISSTNDSNHSFTDDSKIHNSEEDIKSDTLNEISEYKDDKKEAQISINEPENKFCDNKDKNNVEIFSKNWQLREKETVTVFPAVPV